VRAIKNFREDFHVVHCEAMPRPKEELLAYLQERVQTPSDINEHLELLHNLVAGTNAQKIVELGVRGGNSTCALVIAASQTGGFVTSVDHGGGAEYSGEPPTMDVLNQTSSIIADKLNLGGYWSLVIKDDLEFAREYDDEIDVLMIDTSHSYEQTKKELATWGHKVVSGGFVIVHDTVSFPEQNKAIWEFLDENQLSDYVEHKNCNGLGIIIKGKDEEDNQQRIRQIGLEVWRYRIDRMQEAIIQMRRQKNELLLKAAEVEPLKKRLEDVQMELNGIKHSLGYKFLRFYGRNIDRLFPDTTYRGKIKLAVRRQLAREGRDPTS